MTNATNTREVVLDVLEEMRKEGVPSHIALNRTLTKYQYLEKQDRAFISRLLRGTLEYQIQLDYVINQFSKVKTGKMKPLIRNLMRMSVYQLMYMDHVPASAVCNEAVKLAVKRGFSGLRGFVNGVLRNISRNLDQISFPLKEKDFKGYISVTYSLPEWIVELWQKTYDAETIEQIAKSFIKDSKTTVRCCDEDKTEALKKSLEEQHVTVEAGSYVPYALKLSGYDYLSGLHGFMDGAFTIQDESSMLVSEIADVHEGDVIIDVCAAPGGKSAHLAAKLHGTGSVYARDISQMKIERIEENMQRLNLKNVTWQVMDATVLDQDSKERADIVLADVPCSGLGVLGKKPDIKYQVSKEQLKSLVELQRRIIDQAWQYVKPGKTLIYSTCTINPAENIENVLWMIKNYPLTLESLDPYLPECLKSKTTKEGYLQLLPGASDTDGFFMARFRREK